MDININLKITLDETPALINTLSAFTAVLQELHPDFEKTFGAKVPPAVPNPPVNAVPVQPPVNAVPVQPPVQQQLVPPAPVAPQPSIPVTAPAPQPAPAAVIPTAAPKQYTLPELQAACGPLMDAGKMDELSAIIQAFGVTSLMDLPQDKYGELAVQLRALGARL